jgi:membrane-bound lytic murein transglycosylase B
VTACTRSKPCKLGIVRIRAIAVAALKGCATTAIAIMLLAARPFRAAATAAIVFTLLAAAVAAQPPDEPRPTFAEWLAGVRAEAVSRGIREDIVDAALADVTEPQPVILERDRSQAETVLSLEKYLARRLTTRLIRSGREAYAREHALVERIAERYGIPPRIIVAIWGAESNFGRFSGVRPTVPALATLAWDPRRATFFRGELFDALEILNRGDIDLPRLRGSWAGAMGQVQFMPSSYLKFAEDFDGDGRRDIWSTPSDVFASIANYLKGHGWTEGETWGREVAVAPEIARRIASDVAPRSGSCQATRNMSVPLPLSRWQELGVRLPGGKRLPDGDTPAALVSGTTRHFLVYPNYDALLDYNCAHSYAISVALLGDAIVSKTPLPSPPKVTKKRAPARRRR